MIFDGAPLPPCPDCPGAGPIEQFFALLLGVLILVLMFFVLAQNFKYREQMKRGQAGNDENERLIDAAPGGRKPWQ